MGRLPIPSDAYYGIQALRASRNFPISGLRLPTVMVEAMAMTKKAAAQANRELGLLGARKEGAITRACDEILAGKYRDQFIVDVFQMGAGTSFHMNLNEVIANRAEQILGGHLGEYRLVHPNDHVNRGQSTNDVFPTAMRLAVLTQIRDHLKPSLKAMEKSLFRKGREFAAVLKSGRTHLQDAAPIRLGQEFRAYGQALKKGRQFLEKAAESLRELGIGGSAVGTGLNSSEDYAALMTEKLSRLTGFKLVRAPDLREAMQSMRPMTEVSAGLRNLAIETTRIANDLRLLASGPRTGLAEIILPSVAPGSSIMPGKVNPSMLEMMNMVCFQIMGGDLTVSAAAQAGQLELNVMMPVIAFNLLFMVHIFGNALHQVRERCIDGIRADKERCRKYAEDSLGMATVLSPHVGYGDAAEIAKEALSKKKSLMEILRDRGLFSERQIQSLLDPAGMTEPGIPKLDKKKRG